MIFWRLRGLVEHLTGKTGWGGTIKRKSFTALMMFLLMLMPTAAQSSTWVEALASVEGGEAQDRVDVFITAHHDAYTLQLLSRDREKASTDNQLSFDYHNRLDRSFGFNVGAHVATRGELLPRNGFYGAPYVVVGPVVITPTIHLQNFKEDEQLMLGSLNIDYYFSNYRLGLRQLVADETEVKATTISLQRFGNEVVWTLYASNGNEVLDIPFYFGDNVVVGGIARVNGGETIDIIFGGNIGERNEQGYITGTIGIRANF